MPGFRWNNTTLWRFLAARLAFSAAALLGAVTVIFFLFALVPADVTADALGFQADPETRAQIRHKLGLDRSLPDRYFSYMQGLATGDLGDSLAGLGDVRSLLLARLATTLPLVAAAVCVALSAGLLLAFLITWLDRPGLYRLADSVSLAGACVPVFVTALLLVALFGRGAAVPVAYDGSWSSAVLPVVALAAAPTFWVARLVSLEVRRVLSRPFILFGRALGFSRATLLSTAFRNVSLLAALGTNLVLAFLLGSFFVEYAFNWPGLGQLLVYSLLRRDLPVVQGVVSCFALMILLADSAVETARRAKEAVR
jgi:ABC-type dipeptide/oligopeptide/nickel transport system permease component